MDERQKTSLLFALIQNSKRDALSEHIGIKNCDSIIDAFEYDRLRGLDSSFCPLFEIGVKCHDMKYLNCYFCACPYYIVKDSTYLCKINSRFAKYIGNILDCSECKLPHYRGFVRKAIGKATKKLID